MPTSSSRDRHQEVAVINRHNERMRLAQERHPGKPICPDHYIPCKLDGRLQCKSQRLK